jgi:hypothetical protein
MVQVFLERDGLLINEKSDWIAYSPEELFEHIREASDPGQDLEKCVTVEQRNK